MRGEDQTGHGQQWLRNIEDLARRCTLAAPAEYGERILEALDLVTSAPAPLRPLLGAPAERAAVAAMVAVGAHESAAIATIGSNATCMLSKGPNGLCMATVVLPLSPDEITAEAEDLGLAVVIALSVCLARVAVVHGLAGAVDAGVGERLN